MHHFFVFCFSLHNNVSLVYETNFTAVSENPCFLRSIIFNVTVLKKKSQLSLFLCLPHDVGKVSYVEKENWKY